MDKAGAMKPAFSDPSAPLTISLAAIDSFSAALWLEHGLARDSTETAALRADIAARSAGKASSSNRRLPVFRRYFGWALRERQIAVDPTLKIRAAKQPPRFPSHLSEAQVEALLRAPDIQSPLGLRDRTM